MLGRPILVTEGPSQVRGRHGAADLRCAIVIPLLSSSEIRVRSEQRAFTSRTVPEAFTTIDSS
jgi:hypothetical protein